MRLARLDILLIGADIADVGEGEGDDLPRERRIGHDFLIAGHGGVEAQLADHLPLGAEAPAPDRPAVGENDDSRRALGLLGARRMCIGHRREEPFRWFAAMSLSHGRYALLPGRSTL